MSRRHYSIAVCGILGFLFFINSIAAAWDKSATYDEPMHVATAWLARFRGDFRLSPDVPPLWDYWIALPLGRDDLHFPAQPPPHGTEWRAIDVLYGQNARSGVDAVNASRWMSILVGLGLAGLIAFVAGELGGGVAAMAAMFAFVFDPNWLGHAPLAKNDVAFAAVYFAAACAIWRVGKKPGIGSVAAVLLLPAICLGTKLSGLIVGPVLVICMFGRAWMSQEWFGLTSRTGRSLAAAGICLAAAMLGYAGLWAQYQFRFDAGPNGLQMDVAKMVEDSRGAEVRTRWQTSHPTQQQLDEWRPGISTRAVVWMEGHRLVPQAWAAGFIYTQSQAGERNAYLLGQKYAGGRWIYFPLAWLFKEPLAMIAAVILALLTTRRSWKWNWTVMALGVPAAVYAMMAVTAEINIGLRHLFPIFPFVEAGLGVAAARAWQGRGKWVLAILAIGLAVETLAAYPDYIAFFNIACGGERGGRYLLGDSNLDWGQDLPLLAEWQRAHPGTVLYLDYFGTCDPAAYGINYVNVPGGYEFGPPPGGFVGPGVAAVSATKLQGLFVADPAVDFAGQFENRQPTEVLGGSIYLFKYPP